MGADDSVKSKETNNLNFEESAKILQVLDDRLLCLIGSSIYTAGFLRIRRKPGP